MALSTLAKEQENFLRYAILIVDHTKEALQDLIELNLKNKHLTFEEFLNQNQHDIYHLCYDFRCCQCLKPPTKRKRIIIPPQLELLFDKYNKLPLHKGTGHNDFCCSYAKVGITSKVLDLSLARCLLVNCCLDVFWYICLTAQGQTLEQFLNLNKHVIYHLWKNNQKCCQCPPEFIFPRDVSIVTENEWRDMFNSVLLPCFEDRKRTRTGTTSVCSVAARPGIDVKDIHPEIQGLMLKWCCSVRDSVEKLVTFRNLNFGHVENAKLSHANFKEFSKETEECILHIASFCKKDQIVKDALTNLHSRPIDATLCSHYQNTLIENINRNEAIHENINLQHRTTRQSIPRLVDKSCKMKRIEKRIDSIETSNAKIKEEIHDIYNLVKERQNRQRLIDQTSAEIESHKKDGAYIEIAAVRHCIKLLKRKNVVILSGREGNGKSRNGLEILRQLKEKNKDVDVFKLIGLTYISDIAKCNVTSIVLFDDVFDKTCEKHIFDHLNSYINRNKVKFIITMRNSLKHACQMILSTHKLFDDFVDIDLNSETFKLTYKEKKEMFANYCAINKIRISEMENNETAQPLANEAETDTDAYQSVTDQAAITLDRKIMNEILATDPFHGFPECCRLFTENCNSSDLDAFCFKWPSTVLVNDIEKLRIEGINNYIDALKYIILILILTTGFPHKQGQEYDSKTECSLVKRDIDAKNCKYIFNVCYNRNVEVHTSDIEYVCKELTARYLVYIDDAYYFQHKAIQDSVLISYSKINLEAIIPLLSFDHLVDIVRPFNYIEQEDEIVIKISQTYYLALAKKIVSILGTSIVHRNDLDRFLESTMIAENDIELIFQLILCIRNGQNTSHHYNGKYIDHFILHLLRNIGKLDDKMLTVNHTEDEMLIYVTIGDKTTTLSIDPCRFLLKAYRSNCKDIFKWLLKNTDHSLFDLTDMSVEILSNGPFEYIKLILKYVKHNMINMTVIIEHTFYSFITAEFDWIIDNVDNSLIDYEKCLDEMIEDDNLDLVLCIIMRVNHRWLNINAVVKSCCKHESSEILEWVLKNVLDKFIEEDEFLNITIYNDFFHITETDKDWHKLRGTCCNINTLFDMANRNRFYCLLEFLFEHDSNLSIKRDQIIEDMFKRRDDEEDNNTHGDDEEVVLDRDDEEHDNMPGNYDEVYFDDEHCQKIIQLIMKYSLRDIDINKLFRKAVEAGFDNVVEELLLNKVDHILISLDITLDILRCKQLNCDVICFDTGHGKILMLLLPRVNYKYIDLNSVMNDVCHFGHSPAVLWLLENTNSFSYDMKNVMNNAAYHGDLKLVEYLYQKHNKEDFDFKTAMLKACRNSQQTTSDVCKWLWAKIDRSVFDMIAALNNASRYNNTEVVQWILTNVDTKLVDAEDALLCACEHGQDKTVNMLLNNSSINMVNFQYAITLACRNKNSGLLITKVLYIRAKESYLDMNAVLSDACKNYRIDIIEWIIETCVKSISVTETNDGNSHLIECLDTHFVDMSWLVTCILDMDGTRQNTKNLNNTMYRLLWLILKKSDPRTIDIHKFLTESCRKDWIEIFKWIFLNVTPVIPYIREATDIACRNGALDIIKWSLENIDAKDIDLHNIMLESCGYGWLECLVLMKKQFNRYEFDMQAAMDEACTYNRVHIVEWLLQNASYQSFNIPLLLQEAGRNGWINIFSSLLTSIDFHNPDIHIATSQALENGQLNIADLVITKVGKEGFDLSSLSEKTYIGLNKEGVVNFLLLNFDPRILDIATIMTNACLFGWKDIVTFIVDNDLRSLCDLSLALNTACDNGELEIAQLLLDKDDPHIFTSVDKSMHSVAVKGWEEIAVLLLDKVEHTQLDIGNALIEACRHGEIDVVKAILRKVDNIMLDIKKALNKACENHMHETLVLCILENIDQKKVDLKTVKIQAIRHKWRKVQFVIPDVDIEDLNQVKLEIETDNIIFL